MHAFGRRQLLGHSRMLAKNGTVSSYFHSSFISINIPATIRSPALYVSRIRRQSPSQPNGLNEGASITNPVYFLTNARWSGN